MKKMLLIILALILLQLLRIAFKHLIFAAADHTLISEVIVSMIFMLIIIAVSTVVIKRKKLDINLFPERFSSVYKILTVIAMLLLIAAPIITKSYELYDLLWLLYNAVVTVIFEEIIFRGLIYKSISKIYNDLIAYIVSTALFGIWHLGYIDTIIWRTSLFASAPNIAKIMCMKVITGLLIGIVIGFLRYKKKNVYLSMLLHSVINIIGS